MGLWKETLKIYWAHTSRYWKQGLCIIFLLPIGVSAFRVALPLFVIELLDALSGTSGQEIDIDRAYRLLACIAATLVIEFSAWRAIGFLVIRVQSKSLRDIASAVHEKLTSMSVHFHADSFSGALIAKGSRFVNELERIQDLLVFDVFSVFIRVIPIAVILGIKSLVLLGVFLLWVVIYWVIISWMVAKKARYSRAEAEASSSATACFADAITNAVTVKAFGAEEQEMQRFSQANSDHFRKRVKSWDRDEYIRIVQNIILASFFFSILYLSTKLVVDGKIEANELLLVQLYILPLLESFWVFSRYLRRFERSLSNAAEMTQIFLTDPGVVDESSAELQLDGGRIQFEDISFEYSDSQTVTVFDGLSFEIEAGQKVGLVGPSGGGKSTITKLLLRFADISAGEILIDGQNIREVSQVSLRKQISYVEQEPILFHRSLADNIAYGNPSASFEQIQEAARKANAHDFISSLPRGYETFVGERGMKLSGGEKQRVAIARAFIKNAPILVLDEATSALDSESERMVQHAMKELMKGRTTLVVAHRLATVISLDRILVLKDGKIVEDGKHDVLVQNDGLYQRLWQYQT